MTRLSRQLPAIDAATIADVMQKSGLSVDDAMNSVAVSREMASLGQTEAAAAVNLLAERLRASPTVGSGTSKLTKPSVSAPQSGSPLASPLVPGPPSPVTPSLGATNVSSMTRAETRLRASPTTAGPCSDGVTTERLCIKRSRGSPENTGASAASAPVVDNEKERELSRTVTRLTSEINEAMRTGDRSKLMTLMRRRDQLRANKQSSSSPTASIPSGGEEGKRARMSTS